MTPLRQLLEDLPDDLYAHALTHPAWAEAHGASFERLEFLGDAVLGLAISAHLFEQFPDLPEGELSKIKAGVVSRKPCAEVAAEADLGGAMAAAAPEGADPALVEQLATRERVLAALTESVIGAAFEAGNYEDVARAVVATFTDRIGHAVHNRSDAKSDLQEFAQQHGGAVSYRVVSEAGPDHDREFTVQVRLEPHGLEATGVGRSKKAAQQLAAREVLDRLDQLDDVAVSGE